MMLYLQNLSNAIEQILANKARSLLTMLGVIIAVTSTVVVVSLSQGFSNYIMNFIEGMGTNYLSVAPEAPRANDVTVARAEMVQADIDEVEQSCTAVRRVAPVVSRQVKVNYLNCETKVSMQGTTDDYQYICNHYVQLGRCFGPVEVADGLQLCVLGRQVVSMLQADDQIIGEHVNINGKRFLVIGILERKGSFFGTNLDNLVLGPYTVALEMFPESRRSLAFLAQANSANEVPEAKTQITTVLRRRHLLGPNQPNDFQVTTQDEILKQNNQFLTIATGALTGIVGISLLVGGIGITNVMLVSVKERTREIGLRKAVGARRRDIMLQFLTEAAVLSGVGGVLGLLLGQGIISLASLSPYLMDLSVPLWAAVLGISFSLTTGVVFGSLPALKAALVHPIDALRSE